MLARGLRLGAVVVGVCCSVVGEGRAQDPELRRAIEDLQRRNAELEARIDALEQSDAEQAERIAPEDTGMVVRYEDIVANFKLFGDVGFRTRNPEPPGRSHSEFAFGSADFFVNAQFGESFRMLSETVVDGESNGEVSLSQERLWGMWIFDESLQAKLGTEHSPVSRWNELYHHGHWLETTIARPILASFEGDEGILPLHRTGLEIGGLVVGRLGKLEYTAAVANGRGASPTDKQPDQDHAEGKQLELDLAFTPAAVPELRIGGAILRDSIAADSASLSPDRALSMRERIGSGNFELSIHSWTVRGEGVVIFHDSRVTPADWTHHAGYLQVERQFDRWTPYSRFDYREMDAGDPFYSPLDRDLDRWLGILGLRYDFATNAALKLEFGLGREEERSGMQVRERGLVTAAIQVSWML